MRYFFQIVILSLTLIATSVDAQERTNPYKSPYEKPYKRSLNGEWEGTLQDRTPLRLTIAANDENVSGFYSLENEFVTIEMEGLWKDDQTLVMHAISDEAMEGAMTVTVHQDHLEGHWLNYGNTPHTFQVRPVHLGAANLQPIRYYNEKCPPKDSAAIAEEEIDWGCSYEDLNALYLQGPNEEISNKVNNIIADAVGLWDGTGFSGIDKELNSINILFQNRDYLSDLWQETVFMTPVLNRSNVLVLRMNTTQSAGGSPQLFNYYLNFDLETGRKLELKDLLRPGYQKELIPIFIECLKYSNYDYPFEFSLDDFTISENFFIQSDGLYLVYRGLDLGALQQIIEVRIPYEYLQDLLMPFSIVGRVVTNY
jgi:hypothetical protein